MKITADDIPDIALGATFLATGGGGDPLVGRLAATHALKTHGDVALLAPEEVLDDATVISVGGIGAPSVAIEKLVNSYSFIRAISALEKYTGRQADVLIPFEVGGGNTLLPIVAAANTGLPLVDADGMGRAFPESQMMTFTIYGVPTCPAVLVDEFGDYVIIEARNEQAQEKLARAVSFSMGGVSMSASNIMDGKTMRRVSVLNTLTLVKKAGQLLNRYRGQLKNFMNALQPLLNKAGYGELLHLFNGKVIDISSKVVGGWDVGTVLLESHDGTREMKLTIKNEFLLAEENGCARAMAPDLICVVDQETLAPITGERLRYGQRVSVIGIGAPKLFLSPEGIAAAGPRAFKFDFDYISLRDLAVQANGAN